MRPRTAVGIVSSSAYMKKSMTTYTTLHLEELPNLEQDSFKFGAAMGPQAWPVVTIRLLRPFGGRFGS
jgi:hypothetical protein